MCRELAHEVTRRGTLIREIAACITSTAAVLALITFAACCVLACAGIPIEDTPAHLGFTKRNAK